MNWITYIAVGSVLALLVHRLTIRRERKAAKRNAAANFRAAVHGALNDVYPLPVKWPDNIDHFLRRAFPALQAAVAQFRPFVPLWQRRAFDRAWYNYRSASGQKKELQAYHHYMGFDSNPDPKGNFRRNVDALLSFAK